MDFLKDYLSILEHVDGLIIIDKNADIVYITERVANLVHTTQKKALGRPVREIVYTTTLDKVLETGEANPWEFYFEEGYTIVSTQRPIYKEGELIGAAEFDLFQNPNKVHKFMEKIEELAAELNYYQKEIKVSTGAKYSIEDILGSSNVVYNLKEKIKKAARTSSTVLISGETGVGKEAVAHAIHQLSQRSFAPFIKINCATFPKELIESELFGYEEGAFTGAKKGGKKGKFELANGGTIFLDEINQLTMEAQPKLLRVLQEREITRIGGEKSIQVNTRIIVATNVILDEMVSKGLFRQDLLYRLNVVEVDVPPLRERLEDVPELIMEFIDRNNILLTKNITAYSHEVLEVLQRYNWPGNIRELQNVIESAMNECDFNEELEIKHLTAFIQKRIASNQQLASSLDYMSLEEVRDAAEKQMIEHTLKICDNNRIKTAQALKISRTVLYRKLEKYNIH